MMKETLSHFEKEMNLCSVTVTEVNKKAKIRADIIKELREFLVLFRTSGILKQNRRQQKCELQR